MLKYSSQSLAIVLAILIIGSIVGFALYARLSRESVRIVDEKASSESHELVETVIGLLNTAGYENVKNDQVLFLLNGCNQNTFETTGCRKAELTLTDLEDIFDKMGLDGVDFEEFSKDLGDDYCLTELGVKNLSAEGITIEQDDVYSVFVGDIVDCTMTFEMASSVGASGFVMSTFYVERENGVIKKYKPYDFTDIVGFKYGAVVVGDNSLQYNADSLKFPTDENKLSKEGYPLDEVRFKSLGGSSTLTWEAGSSCQIKAHLLVEVGSTCGDKYVGKSFVLPEEYFAPPMFDYVYFQGQGNLN